MPTSTALHLIVTLLLLFQPIIYLLGFSVARRRYVQWLSLFVQTGLILLITQLTQLGFVPFLLSPTLFLSATVVCHPIRPILIFAGGYLVLFFIYLQTVGNWNALWGGGYAPIFGFLGLSFLVVVLLLYLRQAQQTQKHTLALLQELDVAHAQLSTYALRVEELTMVTERQRIARELHDTLVQGVAALLMQMNVVQAHLQHQKVERAQEILGQVMEAARDTLADARCAIGELRSTCIHPGDLGEVVQEEISRFSATTEIPCIADIALLSRTPAPCCEHVLRAITEGLNNIARHAQAHTVWIHVTQHEEVLMIEVRDDGIGFDSTSTDVQIGHYGLLGMRERAKLIGGYLEIKTACDAGTMLRFHIPISSEWE
jgi:NarL family two-component system sensor histidine kinase YdfH